MKKSIYTKNALAYEIVIEELKTIFKKYDDDLIKKIIENSIIQTLRKKSEYEVPKYISVLAHDSLAASKYQISRHGHVHEINNLIEPIILDHCNPITDLVRKYLNNTLDSKQLIEQNFTAVLLRTEDKKLSKNKYKSKRSMGWEKAYEDCGIKIKPYNH